jgi:hypothetical protein
MRNFVLEYKPIEGKTYSLFGKNNSTDEYYHLIRELVKNVLEKYSNRENLTEQIKKKNNYNFFKEFIKNSNPASAQPAIENSWENFLSVYTTGVKEHFKDLGLFKLWDKTLSTSEKQYHLYMLKIELVNQLNKKQFKKCEYKIGLLPHCLRDLTRECLKKTGEYDYICKGCSKKCYLNFTSTTLKKYNVDPYIWMTVDLNSLFKNLRLKYKNFGVFGMACIPELFSGMIKCIKKDIPVIGLPLDANRCVRWMGEFHENSINTKQLEELLN